jgi:CMP/dCMP kinase
MNSQLIITIGRQYGAGGIEVARRLSRKLSIPFYDKELLTQAAKESGIAEQFFHTYDEKVINTLFYFSANEYDPVTMPRSQQLFSAQSRTILNLASKGSCIFIGRCADYVLRDFSNCVNVFLIADPEIRAKRMVEVFGIDNAKVSDLLTETDKQRGRYYESITDRKWNDLLNYNLVIDSGRIGIDRTVDLILSYIKR